MRRTLAAALCGAGLTVPPGFASERLFPTDVLEAGEIDTFLTASYFTFEQPFSGLGISREYERLGEFFDVRAGIGHGLHLTAGVPYFSREQNCFLFGGTRICDDADEGWQNASFGAKYSVLGQDHDPLSLSALVEWTTNSAAEDGDGLEIAFGGGWAIDPVLRLYSWLAWNFSNDDNEADTLFISVGAFRRLTDRVMLDPSLYYRQYQDQPEVSSFGQYGVSLDANVQIGNAAYLIPGVGYTYVEGIDTSGLDTDSFDGWSARLSLYLLFGETNLDRSEP